MKPYIHAQLSAKRYGGDPDEYMDIHNFLDSSKAHVADMSHRLILHNSFGIYVAEQMFGPYRVNTDHKTYQVRDIAEEHVLQDIGKIPSLQDCLGEMPAPAWLLGRGFKSIKLVD